MFICQNSSCWFFNYLQFQYQKPPFIIPQKCRKSSVISLKIPSFKTCNIIMFQFEKRVFIGIFYLFFILYPDCYTLVRTLRPVAVALQFVCGLVKLSYPSCISCSCSLDVCIQIQKGGLCSNAIYKLRYRFLLKIIKFFFIHNNYRAIFVKYYMNIAIDIKTHMIQGICCFPVSVY